MKFEKWQALGNDYLIVEAAGSRPVTSSVRTSGSLRIHVSWRLA